MSKRMLVCRGVPGAGKSTMAQALCYDATQAGLKAMIASADNYFIRPVEDGTGVIKTVYKYDPNQIGAAHRSCQQQAESAMRCELDLVIIDNTNIRIRDFQFYLDLAKKYGYTVEIREPGTPWWHKVKPLLRGKRQESELKKCAKVFAETTTHGVPEHGIMKMLMRWEEYKA
jgi:2',3'-cyclic-nucleotide 3'-phosphodiesterase